MQLTSSMLTLVSLALPALATNFEKVARQTTSPAERVGQALIPKSVPTAAPKPRWAHLDTDGLFGRAASLGPDTCGYISGTSSYFALTCGTGYTCTNSGSYRGCCTSAACSASTNYYTQCYDSTAAVCSASSRGINTLCCTYSTLYPYCITYLWSTTASPGAVFTEFNCDRQKFSGVYFLAAESPLTSSSTSTTSTSSRTTSTTTSTTSSSSSSLILSISSASPTPTQDNSSPGVPVGPVVGGVVGGVAVLALMGFLAFFLIRKNKKNKAVPPPPPPQMVQHTGGTYPGPPGPGYDPRYSTYTGAAVPHSPNSGGYPSPVHSPTPYNNMAGFGNHPTPPMQEGYGQGGYIHPQQTGTSFAKTNVTGNSAGNESWNSPTPREMVSELPHRNQTGTGNNRAELA